MDPESKKGRIRLKIKKTSKKKDESGAAASRFKLFAVSPPGLEETTLSELVALGITGRIRPGGVEFSGGLAEIYGTNLWLRSASRVLLRLGTFGLEDLRQAKERFRRYPWELYFRCKGGRCRARLRVTCHKSRIYHSGALAERLQEAIEQRIGCRLVLSKDGGKGKRTGHLEEEDAGRGQLVVVRLFRDKCTLSVDTSGKHLHYRGLKPMSVRAPLRENLAAAMLLASGWRPDLPLLDPFCGSGTILMEAALISMSIPPGRARSFAFQGWRNFDKVLWNRILAESDLRRRQPQAPIIGLDKDLHAIEAAASNLGTSGLGGAVRLVHGDLTTMLSDDMVSEGAMGYSKRPWEAGGIDSEEARSVKRLLAQLAGQAGERGGFIVTNPPYGKRLKDSHALTDLYSRFGQVLRQYFRGWKVAMLCPHDNLKKATGLHLRPVCHFSNGGIRVQLLVGTI